MGFKGAKPFPQLRAASAGETGRAVQAGESGAGIAAPKAPAVVPQSTAEGQDADMLPSSQGDEELLEASRQLERQMLGKEIDALRANAAGLQSARLKEQARYLLDQAEAKELR
eukprot:13060958-Alexandrium_andersonii.AAC.1